MMTDEPDTSQKREPLVSEVHPNLFHYTTETGLYGILKSQSLWATHYAYLNDSQELTAARPLLVAAMHKAVKKVTKTLIDEGKLGLKKGATIDELADQESGTIVDVFYRVTLKLVTPFVFSFCSHDEKSSAFTDGLLSQWRAYGKDGGFAVQFETQALEELMEKDAQQFVHSMYSVAGVIYGEGSEDFEWAQKDIETVASVANLMIPYVLHLNTTEPDLNQFYKPFIKIATRLKNSSFSEEKEVRIVYIRPEDSMVPEGRSPPKPIEFRPHKNSWIPYVELFADSEIKPPVKRVIVGPHPRAELRKNTLELFLARHGIDAKIDVSKIPYLPE